MRTTERNDLVVCQQDSHTNRKLGWKNLLFLSSCFSLLIKNRQRSLEISLSFPLLLKDSAVASL